MGGRRASGRLLRWLPLALAATATLLAAQLLTTTRQLASSPAAAAAGSSPARLSRAVDCRKPQRGLRLAGCTTAITGSVLGTADALAGQTGKHEPETQATSVGVGGGAAAEAGAAEAAQGGSAGAAHDDAATGGPSGASGASGASGDQEALHPAGSQQQAWLGRQLPPGTMDCTSSGYCSVGRTRTWRGDIASNAALREMLEAVSFRREVRAGRGGVGWRGSRLAVPPPCCLLQVQLYWLVGLCTSST